MFIFQSACACFFITWNISTEEDTIAACSVSGCQWDSWEYLCGAKWSWLGYHRQWCKQFLSLKLRIIKKLFYWHTINCILGKISAKRIHKRDMGVSQNKRYFFCLNQITIWRNHWNCKYSYFNCEELTDVRIVFVITFWHYADKRTLKTSIPSLFDWYQNVPIFKVRHYFSKLLLYVTLLIIDYILMMQHFPQRLR